MRDIAILGVGGFAREVATLIQDINAITHTYNLLGFVDNQTVKGTIINGYPVIGTDEDIAKTAKPLSLVLAFGEPRLKMKVVSKFSNPLIDFPTIIHPSVLIGDKRFVQIGKGCIICAGCMITTNIVIKDYVTLNLMCTVGHDTTVGNYAAFMPSCNISGEVDIEDGVYCGTGVKIINQLNIGENTIVGAGAVVAKSLPANCTAVGVPAKPIKFHNE